MTFTSTRWYLVALFVVVTAFIAVTFAQTETTVRPETAKTPSPSSTKRTTQKTSTRTTVGPTLSPEEECRSKNSSCETCVAVAKCLWCFSKPQKCIPYPVGQLIPHSDVCDLGDARWGVCWVNFKVLLITMGVLAGVILLSLTCCIYCCCCRSKSNSKKYRKEEEKWERQKEERKLKSEERRAERAAKHDEIRKKYGIEIRGGLVRDNNPYQRFDDKA